MPAPDRRGQPVAQVEIRHEILAAWGEEPPLAEPGFDPLERPLGLVELDRVDGPHADPGGAGARVGLGPDTRTGFLGTAGATLARV